MGQWQVSVLDSSLRVSRFSDISPDISVHVLSFPGARDMWRAYSDMREANYIGADKYFHARGNYDAAQRGPGGEWAARMIR